MLDGLKGKLLSLELAGEFALAFEEEVNRSAAETSRRVAANRLQHATIERKIAGIVSAIEDGAYCRALSDRLGALEREKESLSLLVAEGIAPVVRIHPRLADIHAEKVAKLELR